MPWANFTLTCFKLANIFLSFVTYWQDLGHRPIGLNYFSLVVDYDLL
jgi:hypothetical protein